MARIRKNDTVMLLAGKDKGKTGKVLATIPAKNRAIVEGVNFVKKHARRTRENEKGGIVEKESSVNMSNLALFCKGCNRPTRAGFKILQDDTKSRFCKKCKEVF